MREGVHRVLVSESQHIGIAQTYPISLKKAYRAGWTKDFHVARLSFLSSFIGFNKDDPFFTGVVLETHTFKMNNELESHHAASKFYFVLKNLLAFSH